MLRTRALTAIATRRTWMARCNTLVLVAYAGAHGLGQLVMLSRAASIEEFVVIAAVAIPGVSITAVSTASSALEG